MALSLLCLFWLFCEYNAQVIQDDGYSFYQQYNKSYRFYEAAQVWTAAWRVCRQGGGRLAMPRSSGEAEVLRAILTQHPPASLRAGGAARPDYAFLGFTDAFAEGVFITDNGETLETYYNSWAFGEPNNLGGDEHCGSLYRFGGLNDLPCDRPAAFVCEKGPRDAVPRQPPRSRASDAGYTFVPGAGRYYRLHREFRGWMSAAMACRGEGAELAHPLNTAEFIAIRDIFRTTPNNILLLGFNDAYVESEYLDMQGNPMPSGVFRWPADRAGNSPNEDCLSLNADMLLNDLPCSTPAIFICQKDDTTPPFTVLCPDTVSDYWFYPEAGYYYRLHESPRSWFEAAEECRREGAALAMPSGGAEALALQQELAARPAYSQPEGPLRDYAMLGFSDAISEGRYLTEDGKSLDGFYKTWRAGQPDNAGGVEDCGALHRAGGLSDIPCNQPAAFICQKRNLTSPVCLSICLSTS